MKYKALGYRLPSIIAEPLFGKRKEFGLVPDLKDADWLEWEKKASEIYAATQRSSVGNFVNCSGYKVMRNIDLKGKTVLEVGPGDIVHHAYWRDKPEMYYLADRREEFMSSAYNKITRIGVKCNRCLIDESKQFRLDFPDNSIDIIVSFYSLEHLYPLDLYINELLRVLKTGGQLVGAIPAEGGLAWGLGRYFTTRRWFRKNTNIDYDKLICWEHPNFADSILSRLDSRMKLTKLNFWPLKVPLIDFNLTISFEYKNSSV